MNRANRENRKLSYAQKKKENMGVKIKKKKNPTSGEKSREG